MLQPKLSLTQDAYERLRADLLACRLPPGTRLKTHELCQSLSVGLSAVREALSRLTSEGLVVAEPQRGFRVTPISAKELRDLTEARIEIEGLCLQRAIASGDVAWEAALVAAYHLLSRTPARDSGDPIRMNDAWSTAHASFHEALVSACENTWLLRLREGLFAQSERYRRLSVPLANTARNLIGEHEEIMNAALGRETKLAKVLMTEHLNRTTLVLLQTTWPAEVHSERRRGRARLSSPGIRNDDAVRSQARDRPARK